MRSDYEWVLENLTKYINSVLRKNDKIVDWAFTIDTSLNDNLVVRIDYINHLHSRTILNLVRCDLETAKMEFDWWLEEYLNEFNLKGEN